MPRKGQVKVDQELLKELARIHCTDQEMAHILGCRPETLSAEPHRSAIQTAKSDGKRSLRRMQWGKAEEGNVAMLIWLGKQMLGQSDKTDVTTGGTPLKTYINLDVDRV